MSDRPKGDDWATYFAAGFMGAGILGIWIGRHFGLEREFALGGAAAGLCFVFWRWRQVGRRP